MKSTQFMVRIIACLLSLTMIFTSTLPLFAADVDDTPQSGSVSSDYPPLLIGVGDLLSITVVGYEHHSGAAAMALSNGDVDIPTDYVVDNSGKIFFPFIDDILLAGLTQAKASVLLEKKLSQYIKFPQVIVLIKASNNYNVTVLGQVTKPGIYAIRGKPTVLSAVSEAGGPIANADLGGSILIHDGKKTKFNLGKYLLNVNDYQEPPAIYPGDVIMVPKDGWPSVEEWAIIASIISSGVFVWATAR
jgi:protein involved in polysaccharide export with SLBB domain